MNELQLARLLKVVRATRPLPGPDGSLLFASNVDGYDKTLQLDAAGATPRVLADTGDRTLPDAWTDLGLVVRHDRGGNETWQLSLVAPGGGVTPLTSDTQAVHQSVAVHPDRRRLGLAWNAGGGRDVSLGELDVATGTLTAWTTPGDFWSWECWSPDGVRGVVTKVFGTWTEGSVLDRYGTLTRLLPGARRVMEVRWTAAGLFMLTDAGDRDFMGLAKVDPRRPEVVERWLVDEAFDIDGWAVDHAGRRAAVVVNRGIFDEVRIVDLVSGETTAQIPWHGGVVHSDIGGSQGNHLGWAPDDSALFASWETPTHPAEIYEWPAGRRWTDITDEAGAGALVMPSETTYRSFDGLEIHCLLYRKDDTARPAVVQFHGGPEGQSRGTYQPVVQLLLDGGVNVLLPNVRGSTGYGFHFQSLDDKTLRWDAVKDGCEAARHLKAEGQAAKTAAMGGSYGGFMTLAVLVEDPALWDAAVDVVGIADWHTFFKNMPPWRGVIRKREYGDPDGAEADFLRQISPLHAAHTIRAPLLVIHGRNDPRVPIEESEQIARKAPHAEMLVFEDEGHGVAKLENQVAANRRIVAFLQGHLFD